MDDALTGRLLGPYRLEEQLGSGASAAVYLGRDGSDREWAIKVRQRGDPAMDRRFLREFESMRLLRVPGVVRVHEAGIEDDFLWFSMDLVSGREFPDVVREEKDPAQRVRRAIELSARLFEILADLHDAGFVHRDVKPSNVLVDKGGEVRILDFGIGMYFSDQATTLSRSGQVLGTIPYMAPEQIAGLPMDRRIDLFAAGLVLWECIAGRRPSPATPVGWVSRICSERLDPLAAQFRQVPLALSHLVERLTAVEPDHRPTAREAAAELHALLAGVERNEWPEPPFVDPGSWWVGMESCLGIGEGRVWVLEGPAGSGKRRLAEQVHREALLQGVWTLHVRCAATDVGGPMARFLSALLQHPEEAPGAFEESAAVLRRIWPRLPLPGDALAAEVPSPREVASAVAGGVAAYARKRRLLLVVHDIEQVDALTARCIGKLARTEANLGILLLVDPRWATPDAQALVSAVLGAGGKKCTTRALTGLQATRVAARLCPKAEGPTLAACSPADAVDAGHRALAAWRGVELPPPNGLWPYAIEQPLPRPVAEALRAATRPPWVEIADTGGLVAAGAHARAAARRELHNFRDGARTVAAAFTAAMEKAPPEVMARLHVLANDRDRAVDPSIAAAEAALKSGRYSDARQWLLLLDTLPETPVEERFRVAVARARVALYTEPGPPRTELAEAADRAAHSERDKMLAKVLLAEFEHRRGEPRTALVNVLRLASPAKNPPDVVALRALVVATHCRLALGQLADAHRELDRAEALTAVDDLARSRVTLGNLRAQLAFAQHDLDACRTRCQALIRDAAQLSDLHGMARAAAQLGQVLRLLGRRQEAEHHTRSAREALATTGEVALGAETGLLLATLLCERGDTVGARHLLDDTIRTIRGLAMHHLLPAALRVTLHIATLRGDTADAAIALAEIERLPLLDAEMPATLSRWWRTRGDVERATAVAPPARNTYGHVLWQVETARASLAGGDDARAAALAQSGLVDATKLQFGELALYAHLILGVAQHAPDDESWRATTARASRSQNIELYLGALEMDARRFARNRDEAASLTQWRMLRARAEELGYRPGLEEAAGWLR